MELDSEQKMMTYFIDVIKTVLNNLRKKHMTYSLDISLYQRQVLNMVVLWVFNQMKDNIKIY